MLLLFDIDGTLLIRAAEAHAEAMLAALERVHGVEHEQLRRGVGEVAGRTDGAIARMILEHAGVPAQEIDRRWPEVARAVCEEYAQRVPDDLSHTVSDGVVEVLEELGSRDDHVLALLTGNLEPVARLKLDRAGVGRWFAAGQGAFGSDHELRERLPEVARRRAGRDGEPWPRERTLIIGDTPRDVACARADGVRCIAVATGPYAPEDLREADAVVRSARELLAAVDGLST